MASITGHLTHIIVLLKHAIGLHLARQARLIPHAHLPATPLRLEYHSAPPPPGPSPLPQQAYELLWHRIHRIGQRFLALFARWENGTLPAPRLRPARPRKAADPADPADPAAPKPLRLPRAFGWANKRMPEAAPASGQLENLLLNRADEVRPFLHAAPQAGRLLRPLCTALGIRPPPYLALPPRPRKPRPPKSPRPRAPSIHDPRHKWRPWEKRAVRGFLQKFGKS